MGSSKTTQDTREQSQQRSGGSAGQSIDMRHGGSQQTSIAGIGQQEQMMRDLMSQLAQQGMGGLSSQQFNPMFTGQFNVTPEDQSFVQQIGDITHQMQQQQARSSYDEMSGAVEDQLLSRGMEGSSIEAVNQAMLGRQLQQSLDMGSLQRQATGAEQLHQMPFQRGQMELQADQMQGQYNLGANQLLLQQILGGAGQLAGMGLQERLAQQSTTSDQWQRGGQRSWQDAWGQMSGSGRTETTKPFDWAGFALQAGQMGAKAAGVPA